MLKKIFKKKKANQKAVHSKTIKLDENHNLVLIINTIGAIEYVYIVNTLTKVRQILNLVVGNPDEVREESLLKFHSISFSEHLFCITSGLSNGILVANVFSTRVDRMGEGEGNYVVRAHIEASTVIPPDRVALSRRIVDAREKSLEGKTVILYKEKKTSVVKFYHNPELGTSIFDEAQVSKDDSTLVLVGRANEEKKTIGYITHVELDEAESTFKPTKLKNVSPILNGFRIAEFMKDRYAHIDENFLQVTTPRWSELGHFVDGVAVGKGAKGGRYHHFNLEDRKTINIGSGYLLNYLFYLGFALVLKPVGNSLRLLFIDPENNSYENLIDIPGFASSLHANTVTTVDSMNLGDEPTPEEFTNVMYNVFSVQFTTTLALAKAKYPDWEQMVADNPELDLLKIMDTQFNKTLESLDKLAKQIQSEVLKEVK